jgi:hypothetical protein
MSSSKVRRHHHDHDSVHAHERVVVQSLPNDVIAQILSFSDMRHQLLGIVCTSHLYRVHALYLCEKTYELL